MAAAFAATVASALASHASVSRLLHVMGRNGVLPQRVFGYIHPRRNTPVYATIAVGVVSLLAITPSLELISSMINFGALVAFTFVNLSVIAYFAIRRRQYRTLNHATRNIALPAIGMALTGVLWSFLHKDALIAGIAWSTIGLIYVLVLNRITGRRVTDVNLHDGDATQPTPTPAPAPTPTAVPAPTPTPVPALATA
jgi:putrescine importer